MKTAIFALIIAIPMTDAFAQEQQAGNDASTNANATFQKLVDQCDDMDMLMLRAQLRLEISRATEAAAKTASDMLTEGFAQCAEGQIDAGKETLSKAYEIARAGVTEAYGQDATLKTSSMVEQGGSDTDAESLGSKPWWKFW
ncbi:MAG: hypothetical protein O3C30_03380 [Proteobacteria bacterium]|nr:hypothetical protein [Pseudomonadota bacterium]